MRLVLGVTVHAGKVPSTLALTLALATAGCGGGDVPSTDGGSRADAGVEADAGPAPADAGPGTEDAGAPADAGPAPADAGPGTEDAGTATGPAARCATITESIRAAGFDARVSVHCDDRYAYIVSDTDPDHPKMNGILGTNDQVPVPAPGYTSPIALAPTVAATPTMIDAALGVAVNGVPIYDYSSQGGLDPSVYDPRFDTVLTHELDLCNGHAGRGDDYHYHASPTCMIAAMPNRDDPAAILGWGFDGFPLYGDRNPDGSAVAAGALDVCNAQPDATFGRRYHTSATHPYIMQCLVGAVDVAMAPRVSPLMRLGGGGGRPPGMKPPGGVTGLTLEQAPDGTRTMRYTHMGTSYMIVYRPASTAGCWDFEDTTYTTGGVLQRGTYCRSPR